MSMAEGWDGPVGPRRLQAREPEPPRMTAPHQRRGTTLLEDDGGPPRGCRGTLYALAIVVVGALIAWALVVR